MERHAVLIREAVLVPEAALRLVHERTHRSPARRWRGELRGIQIEVEAQDHRSVEPQLRQLAELVAVGSAHLHAHSPCPGIGREERYAVRPSYPGTALGMPRGRAGV